jgi:prophage regulatory protein
MSIQFLRMPAVCARRSLSRPTLYRDIARGQFPPPVKIGRKASAWVESEVDAVLAAQMAGADSDALCALVRQLVEGRRARAELIQREVAL